MARVLLRSLSCSHAVWMRETTALAVTTCGWNNKYLRFPPARPVVGTQARCMAIFRSTLPDMELPEMTFFNFVSRELDNYGDAPAIVYSPRNITYKFSEIRPLVRRLGSGLTRRGFKAGDVFCIFMKNNPEYLPTVYAVSNIGGVVTTSNPVYTPEELAYQLKDSGANYIMTTPDLLETVGKAVSNSQKVKNIFIVGEHDGHTSFADLASDDGSAYPENVIVDVKNDVAFLLYSSGTTGLPKGVMLTHYNLVANTVQTKPLLGFDGQGMTVLFLPMYHVYGLVVATAASLSCGHGLVVLERFDGREFLGAIQKYKIRHLPVVPPVVTFLAKSDLVDEYDLSSVVDVICGAAPLSADMQSQLWRRLKMKCRQGYGMTETGPVIALDSRDCEGHPGAAGFIIPNTEVRIVDVETGENLDLKQEGEIVARGPQIMKGYLNNEEATRNSIKDGWMHTGDVGYVDETNRLFVVDRVKELIKYKGLQVAPAELEGVLGEHPDIADCGVVGVPDEECGEIPKAFVVLKKDKQLTVKQIQDFVAERVAKFKRLKGGVEFIDEIPRAASGKILRRKLRQR